MRHRTLFAGVALCAAWWALGAASANARQAAAAHTDFSGTWKLNLSKSDFGPIPPPDSRTDVITQTESSISDSVTSESADRGEQKYSVTFVPDGKEHAIPPDSPQAHAGALTIQKLTSAWQGGALGVTEDAQFGDNNVLITSTYTLSADRDTLTIASHGTSANGEVDLVFVFDKQAAGAAAVSAPSPAGTVTTGAASSVSAASPAGSVSGHAAAHPDLSGTWKLNAGKSNFGQFPPPDGRTEVIAAAGPSIKIDSDIVGGPTGEMKFSQSVTTDGKESSWTIMENPAKSTAQWDGNSLVVNTTSQFQDNEMHIKDTYSLGPDGKTLTLTSDFSSQMGENQQKLVFDKQM